MTKRHSIICASYLLLAKDNKILLLRRFNTGYEDGNYSVPAGHVDEGEPVSEGLLREAKEEVGVSLKKNNLDLRHVMHRKATAHSDERLDFFFVCEEWNGKVKNMEPEKCDDLSWFDIDSLPENTIPYIRTAITHVFIEPLIYSELYW